jgi:predicted nucleic acid-binding protein
MQSIRTAYLDASAIVKLLVNEDGSAVVRDYFYKNSVFAATSLCFAETLGALKVKFNHQLLSPEQYFAACAELVAHLRNQTLEIEDINISESSIFDEVERIATKHALVVSSAYQFLTL